MLHNSVIIFLSIIAVMVGLNVWAHVETLAYLRAVPEIKAAKQLESFKRLAGRNMLGALIYLLLLLPALGFGIYAVVKQTGIAIGVIAIAVVLIPALGKRLLSVERQAREQPCATPELAAERDRISHIWIHKAWPNFE